MGGCSSALNLIRGHIGALAVLLAVMVAAIVFAAVKLKNPMKGFVQWQSVIAFIALAAFVVNTMLTGPLYNTLSVVLSGARELSIVKNLKTFYSADFSLSVNRFLGTCFFLGKAR